MLIDDDHRYVEIQNTNRLFSKPKLTKPNRDCDFSWQQEHDTGPLHYKGASYE